MTGGLCVVAARIGAARGVGGSVELRAVGVEPPDAEQDFERDVASFRLQQPVAVEAIVEPCPDPLGLLGPDEVDLVEDHHVSRRDLPDLQLHVLGSREDLLRVDNADDAVEADPVDQRGVVGEGERDPGRLGYSARLQQDVLGPFRAAR